MPIDLGLTLIAVSLPGHDLVAKLFDVVDAPIDAIPCASPPQSPRAHRYPASPCIASFKNPRRCPSNRKNLAHMMRHFMSDMTLVPCHRGFDACRVGANLFPRILIRKKQSFFFSSCNKKAIRATSSASASRRFNIDYSQPGEKQS